MTGLLMTAAVTVSVVGISYVALHPDDLTGRAETVADQVSCHTVDDAVVAYAAQHGAEPRTIADLRPYVRGDISAYSLVGGLPTGPGCTTAAR
jgi:hypothetical protein